MHTSEGRRHYKRRRGCGETVDAREKRSVCTCVFMYPRILKSSHLSASKSELCVLLY